MGERRGALEDLVKAPFGDVFSGKRVIVTGNTGFKGSWLTVWLSRLGADVYGLSVDIPTQPSPFEIMGLGERITQHWFDIREKDVVAEVFSNVQPDFVFHLAAQPVVSISYQDPVGTLLTNAIGTANVLEALRTLKNRCAAVFITSDKCYHNVEWLWGYRETDRLGGKDLYSASKACAEKIIQAYYFSFLKEMPELRIASARAGNVIGGGDWTENRIVPDCVRSWGKRESVEIRNPGATRPWQHVLEPLSGYLSLAAALSDNEALDGESFNFGPRAEQNVTVEEVVRDLAACLWPGGESSSNAYHVSKGVSFHEAGLLKLNCDKALALLGWRAVLDYKRMVQFTGEWYREYMSGKETDMYWFTMDQISAYEKIAGEVSLQWVR